MRGRLREAGDIVVGEFQSARQRLPMAGAETRLVGDDEVARRPAAREDGVAARRRPAWRPKREDATVTRTLAETGA